MKKPNISLIEYYRQFIEVVTLLYKPSLRGNLNVQDPLLIQDVKRLYDHNVTIKSITQFFSNRKYKNIERLDHQELVRYFLEPNIAIKAPVIGEDITENGKVQASPQPKSTPVSKSDCDNTSAHEVFRYYAERVDGINSKMKPTDKELRMINDRLTTNSVKRLKGAVDGALLTPYIASNGFPLAMIFHACSTVNQLIIVSQRRGTQVNGRRSQNIREALADISGANHSSKASHSFSGAGAAIERGETYDHQYSDAIEHKPTL